MNSFLKIAHRGFTLLKKNENTLFSFQNAVDKKFDMIELDIHLCKSKDIVIYHDNYIKKNDKYHYIKDLTYQEIIQLNPHIITLPFFFDRIDKEKIQIFLDVKGSNEIMNPLLDYLNHRFNNFDNLMISSFNRKCVKDVIEFNKKKSNKKIKTGFTTENIFTNIELYILLKNIDYLIVYWCMLDKNVIEYCHSNNKKVFCYTCRDLKELDYIKKFNVDGVISDILI